MELLARIEASLRSIRIRTQASPSIGVILGTGLGGLADAMQVELAIDYGDIPYFPVSTVESHRGRLLFGTLAGRPVVVMQGRFHRYEGYDLQTVTYPVRVMHALGVHTLIVSNACGGLHPLYRRADLMVIDDHINLIGDNPLIGPNEPTLGPRFPDMSEPYSRRLQSIAQQTALALGIPLHRGVYVAVAGPNLETRAEYRFLRTIGADVVGMSTVPENIVARHMGMEVLGLSIITDECFPDALHPVRLQDVLDAAAAAEPRLTALVQAIIPQI